MKEASDNWLTLKPYEHRKIETAPVKGGQLALRDKLLAKFVKNGDGNFDIMLTDAELGEVQRQAHYGNGVGGWQQRLRDAFLRPIMAYMGAKL